MDLTRTVLYDEAGNVIDDEALAYRGELIEIDDEGNDVQVLERWTVNPKSLDGDEGELPTRPHEL